MAHLFLRRFWLIAVIVALGSLTAWLAVRDDPKIYERTLVFVLRPSPALDDSQVPDAVRGLAQEEAQLLHTVSRVAESDRLLHLASKRGFARSSLGDDYTLKSVVTPGSDVIEVRLRGPEPTVLNRLGAALAVTASRWVARVYGAYRLEFLEAEVSSGPVLPETGQTVLLAALLAALVAVGAVFTEAKLREKCGETAKAAPAAADASEAPLPPAPSESSAVSTLGDGAHQRLGRSPVDR
jgi:hypothetical protein